jgi:hypothetical protein
MSDTGKLFEEMTTPEGVRVVISDLSRNYGYQNIFEVRLKVTATFPDADEVFERMLEKMGVFEEDLDATRDQLVATFKETGLPYLASADFPKRLKAKREAERPRTLTYG